MFERHVPRRPPPPSSSNDDYVDVDDVAENDDLQCGSDDDRRRDGVARYYSPMDVAATAAHRLLRAKVRDVAETKSGKRDGVGVLLYGCDPNRNRRRRSSRRSRRRGGGDGGGGGKDDDIDIEDDDEDYEGEEDALPTTHELIELAAPGIGQVLAMQECLPDYDHDEDSGGGDRSGRRRRDLRGEFSIVPRRKKTGDGGVVGEEGAELEDDDDDFLAVCSLRRGLAAALKIFSSAK
jgi:hypothetical protein